MSQTKPNSITLRPARPDDAAALSALALRSKGYWPYAPEFLEACRDELTYTVADLVSERLHFFVAEAADVPAGCQQTSIIGFYALATVSPTVAEVEALFVAPEAIGQGLGGQLWRHAVDRASTLGITTLTIQSDPHAEPFYTAMGAVTTGTKPSGSVPGRVLPLMEFCVPVAAQ